MTTAIEINKNKKLAEIVIKSGIDRTKAEAHVQAFKEYLTLLEQFSRPLADLNKEHPTDAKKASVLRKALVKVRTGAESIKNERKEGINAEANLIQATYNLIKNACIITEGQYEEIENYAEIKEKQRLKELAELRAGLINPFLVGEESPFTFEYITSLSESDFNSLLEAQKNNYDNFISRQLAEIEAEEAAQKAEAERMEKIESENKELKEKFDKEQEKNRLEKEKLDKELKELARLQKIADDERIELQAEINKAKELENARLAKIEADKQAEMQAKEAAQKAPDRDKMRTYFASIKKLEASEFENKEYQNLAITINLQIDELKKFIVKEITKIK